MPLADATQTEPHSEGGPGHKGAHTATAVRVVAPARLHLGFLDLNGGLGRRFGSIGLAIDQPATALTLARSRTFEADGPDRERALATLRALADAFAPANAYRLTVQTAIPAHAGLGSGTQLALAVGAGLTALEGIEEPVVALGNRLDRGARSAIGMAAFEHGGFIVDGGRGSKDQVPPILLRTAIPEAWRVLLIMDHRTAGVHGEAEAKAFAALPPLPQSAAAHVCHLVLMRLAPALMETDIKTFGAAVTEIQAIIGAHFAAAQGGGPWTSPAVGRIAERLKAAGAFGIGQSSWGPTGFAFAATQQIAQRLYESLNEAARAEGLKILIAKGRNRGALIERIASPQSL